MITQITSICFKHQLNIVHNNEYVDNHTGSFFIRTELEELCNDEELLADLDAVLPVGAIRELNHARRLRIVVLVTKEAHCLEIC